MAKMVNLSYVHFTMNEKKRKKKGRKEEEEMLRGVVTSYNWGKKV